MLPALLAALTLFSAPAFAAGGEEALRADVAEIVDLFYGHDFERAVPAAAALEQKHPGHPAGPLFIAVVRYQRWAAEGLKDDGSWEEVDRELSRAVAEAEAMKSSDPAGSYYYLGAAQGFRARGQASRHRFLRALPDAALSLRNLKTALALDPDLTDARLGLGMYHYFASRMPTAAKPFARLLTGEPGDRDRGLAELWSVARSSGAARMEARAVLAMILSKNDEADWDGAEALLAELMTRYPRNPLYRLRRVYVAERRGDWTGAVALADPDGRWIAGLHPGLRANARAWALYRAGEAELLGGRPDAARKTLARIDESSASSNLRRWLSRRRKTLADPSSPKPTVVAPFFSAY